MIIVIESQEALTFNTWKPSLSRRVPYVSFLAESCGLSLGKVILKPHIMVTDVWEIGVKVNQLLVVFHHHTSMWWGKWLEAVSP